MSSFFDVPFILIVLFMGGIFGFFAGKDIQGDSFAENCQKIKTFIHKGELYRCERVEGFKHE